MSSAREVRTLAALVETASTARVLNLALRDPAARAATPPERVLFRASSLDRAIIVKHRLRPHENDWFVAPKTVSTKLLIPIDPLNLNIGAHSLMVNQKGFDEALVRVLGVDKDPESGARDRAVLTALDDLPSLDPFLTREHLNRRGFKVADDYFDISPADVARMTTFVREDIVPLVSLCFGSSAGSAQATKLTEKILSADLDDSMDPLRLTLKMDTDQFVEGIFCWKGFLYYKWVLAEVMRGVQAMAQALNEVKIVGEATPEETAFVAASRVRIKGGVKRACRDVRDALAAYDLAFEKLTRQADPIAFRDFLLAAPKMFFDVGEKLGAVQHLTSFWSFRFRNASLTMPAPELCDLFGDFENSLGAAPAAAQSWAA